MSMRHLRYNTEHKTLILTSLVMFLDVFNTYMYIITGPHQYFMFELNLTPFQA